jgi:N-acetylmuramoyl-L-alanine amidase
MSNIKRLKRQMLRELVRENVELIEGLPPWRERRRARFRLTGRVLALALLPVALLGSSRLISSFASPPAAPVRAARTAARAAVQPALQLSGSPEPIDAAVFPLAVRKIAIDAGHGGQSVGTHAGADAGTEKSPLALVEKDITLDVGERLRKLLVADHFQVVMTRDRDVEVPLERRGAIAKEGRADIFVSIHVNWIENRKVRGVETYFLGATEDPFLTRLAAEENRESGYSLADMRKLLDGIYADVRHEKSHKLAETMQAALFKSLRKINPHLDDRGVKAAPFIVLLSTEMPAVLAEVSCLSNKEEAELLAQPTYRQSIAEALAAGVRSYADAVEGKPETTRISKKGT